MRATCQSGLVAIGITAAMVTGPADASQAAVNPPPEVTIASVLPSRDSVVGVAHPVVVTFDGPVANRQAAERAMDVHTKPAMTGKVEWLDNNVAQWVPDRFWPAHSTIALSVGGQPTDFETGPAVVGVADISDHTFTVSIDGIEAHPPPRLPAPHHRPQLGEEGVLLASMGRPQYPTPTDTFHVMSKDRSVAMDSSTVGIPIDDPDGYLFTVDYAVRFSGRGLYVHSAPWAAPALGIENVSHGCINLSAADAQWYFDTVNIGDPIVVQE